MVGVTRRTLLALLGVGAMGTAGGARNTPRSHESIEPPETAQSLSATGSLAADYAGSRFYDPGPSAAIADWNKDPNNPVLENGANTTWEDNYVGHGTFIREAGTYHLWYNGHDGLANRIGHASSPDLVNWTKNGANPVLDRGSSGEWDAGGVRDPAVVRVGDTYHMVYQGYQDNDHQIGYAYGDAPDNWTKAAENPVLTPGDADEWDAKTVGSPSLIRVGETFHLFYMGMGPDSTYRIGHATSRDCINWECDPSNPILEPGPDGAWDCVHVEFPSVIRVGKTYYLLYTGWDGSIDAFGLATSTDLSTWAKGANNPVLEPGPDGAWDGDEYILAGSWLRDGDRYEMLYTGNQGSGGTNRIGRATLSL